MTSPDNPTRRTAIQGAVAAGAAAALPNISPAAEPFRPKGNVKHSVVFWCFNVAGDKWDVETACKISKDLGCVSIEIIDPEHWPVLKKHGLTCAIAPNGYSKTPFMYGLNNTAHQADVIAATKKRIDECAAAGVPNVISFTGYKWRDPADPKSGEISRDEGAAECVKALKELAGLAEKKGVTICLEHLNTRDDTHPMKGHPGYQGDDVDYCAAILRKVGSPRVKMLFDIYHIQAMHGDVIRRIEQNKDVIGHIHTAGNPGRGELDDTQEINFPAIMRKLLAVKYDGYVGHEFIPTRDPRGGLAEAIRVCDV
ncbi:TIM barrel protein [Fimbriiglobus ruber]|uniref:Hydroxypyruvate isomerase n=1 Tax=Fimbriiglobus ruber TaxID=1908690 RepID=A0A225DXS2_9BACT|nr:TIM barrel protein [Fimbriiglobus ruber]OWK43328.1 Hydroxypyruvate isomerase [Fimbriiglobus ruber]